MFGIGGWEMLLIGVVALLVFGPKRLPELARSMGKGLAEFRRASNDLRRSIDLDFDPAQQSAPDPETQPPAQAGQPDELPATLADAQQDIDREAHGSPESPEDDEHSEANGASKLDRGSAGDTSG